MRSLSNLAFKESNRFTHILAFDKKVAIYFMPETGAKYSLATSVDFHSTTPLHTSGDIIIYITNLFSGIQYYLPISDLTLMNCCLLLLTTIVFRFLKKY